MRKFLFFAVTAFLLSTPIFAQVNILDIDPAVEAKCTQITRTMALELRLNEREYIKLKEMNRERMVETDHLLQTYSLNAPELNEKLDEIKLAYEREIVSFLTPNQLHAYANYKPDYTNARFVAATHP